MISAIFFGFLVTFSCIIFHQWIKWIPTIAEGVEEVITKHPHKAHSMYFKKMQTQYHNVISEPKLDFSKFGDDKLSPETEKYLIYLPYEGLGNQRLCLLRALYAARHLSRTLLIPPLMSSYHNNLKLLIDWRTLYDFSQFASNATVKVPFKFVGHRMIRNVRKLLESKGSECLTHGRYVGFKDLSSSSRQFLYHFGLTWRGRYEWHNMTGTETEKASYMMEYFEKKREAPMVCATNFQYISFGTEMSEYWEKLLPSKNLVLAAWNYMCMHGIENTRYAAIHWRRGDFEWYCRKKEFSSCWPEIEDLKAKIFKIHEEHGIDLFLVGTNERTFELDMSEFGIDVVHITLPYINQDEPAEWRELAPVALDEFVFEHADFFLGNKYSSLSFSVTKRRHMAGLQNTTESF